MSYPKQPEGPAKRVGKTNVYKIEIKVVSCKQCGKHLVPTTMTNRDFDAFPWLKPAVMQQLEKAGVHLQEAVGEMNGGPICTECEGEAAVYECYWCEKKVRKDEIQESFGWPREHLCKHCYETLPAKKWDELLEELNEAHRYDFNA